MLKTKDVYLSSLMLELNQTEIKFKLDNYKAKKLK